MDNPFSIDGKVVLITGASSGIGRGIAVECSKLGAKVIITGRNEKRLTETFSMLTGEGHLSIIGDLSTQEGIDKLVSDLPSAIDGAVFCAGIPQMCTVKHLKRSDVEAIFSINTIAPMMLTSALVKTRRVRDGSSLVFIESVTGVFVGSKGDATYNASKGGLNGFLKAAALELAKQGIRVNAVNPGLVPTPILNLSNTMTNDDHHATIMQDKYPLKRLGTPEDIAYGVIYLLSDAASWITGTNVVIDGGYLLN